ncbi:MAG: UDP-3-O-(3-hydroxymyristoyl)glucosamine N-acyltransferase, partial [Verrucomicrobia bacterium]|nr:UDP-3-O-(3-hydroxymyristoyl)glucosamine N-acyltransferase [Verrucomicrobiota bacterium]
MQVSFSPADIIAITQPKAQRGSTGETIRSLASLASSVPGDLSFLGNAKYKTEVATTRASIVLLPAD